DQLIIIADADDLHGATQKLREISDDGRRKSDSPRLTIDVLRLGITNKPVIASIDPDVQSVFQNEPYRLVRGITRKSSLFDNGQIEFDEHPAVEACNRRIERERLDQHRHSFRRAATGDGEFDASGAQCA